MTDRKMAFDGYNKAQTLSEGYLRKGGINPPKSQIQVRPPAPAPMRAKAPAATVSAANTPPRQV
jgi:hypothetical protein